MRRPPPLALVSLASLVWVGSCGDPESGGTSTSAGSTASASTTAAQTSDASASATATSTTATGGVMSTTQASTTSNSTSGATTRASDPGSSGSASDTSDTSDTTSAGDTTEGGGDPACVDLGRVDFGACDAIVGWIFDGEACVLRSGCGCMPHCDAVFASAQACAEGCAGAGACDPDKMHAAGIAADPFVVGSFCDEVDLCGADPQDVDELFPGIPCQAQGGYPCEGTSLCTAYHQGEVDSARWQQLCAASLLPGVTAIQCTVWGP